MDQPQFAYTLISLLPMLEVAARQAESLLSKEMRTQHWVSMKHGPNAWEAVAAKFGGQPETTPLENLALVAMPAIITAQQKILGALESVKLLNAPPPDLSVSKMRRE